MHTTEIPHAESTGLMPSISIPALLAARDEAHRIFFEMAEQVRTVKKALGRFDVVLPGVGVCFPGAEYLSLSDEDNAEAIMREIDRHVWVQLFQKTQIDTIMDSKTRNALFAQLGRSQRYRRRTGSKRVADEPNELPELTQENIETVFQQLHEDRIKYFEQSVEAVFKSLSWEHSTNEPGKIGKKLILYGAFMAWQRQYQGDTTTLSSHESIHDLERVLCILNGQAPPTHDSPGLRTIGALTYGKWTDVPNPDGKSKPLLSIICYRKGTAHLKILDTAHRDDMNRIMAHMYPGAIPEPQSARRSQWGDAQAKRPKTSTSLVTTEKQARQAFYTPAELAEEVATAALGSDWAASQKTVLEPSAGSGSLVRAALHTRCKHVAAIENDPKALRLLNLLADRVNVHDESRLSVDSRDFFDVTPANYPEGFDAVVMNPPFAHEQEVEHVLHAWEFVKPGGRLVAIMSAGVIFRTKGRYKVFDEFLKKHEAKIRKNPSASFKESGTSVETVMVTINKPA